jgi:ssDNA-binding Zn-finger/Zn-ribbon topoisomerase 1
MQRACPLCQAALVERTNRATGIPFFGCERWPECSFTQPIPADEWMRRQGAMPLPGFE